MAKSIIVANRTLKGISALACRRKSDNVILNFEVPMSFVVQDGREVRQQMTRNAVGEMALINLVPTQQVPMLTVTYPSVFIEKYVTSTDYQPEEASFNIKYTKYLQVPSGGVVAAVASGFYGFSVVEDASGYASKELNGVSVGLTQAAYVGFNNAIDDQFAVGDNGELLFSLNLVDDYVTLAVDMTINGVGYSDLLQGEFEISATMVNSLNEITHFYAPNAIIDPSGRTLDSSAEQLELMFYLLTSGSQCRAYELVETKEKVVCGT